MDGLTLLLVVLSVAVFVASRVVRSGRALTILAALLSASSALAVLSDQSAENWQIVLICILAVYTFLTALIMDPEEDKRWQVD